MRLISWADPVVAGQDDVVLAYGDSTGTHINEYKITTSGTTTTVTPLASFTDPTTIQFKQLTSLGDGRVAISYDKVLDSSETSQQTIKTFDFRTAGLSNPALSSSHDNYIAGTHQTDTVTGVSGVNNFYEFVGLNTNGTAPVDHFNGGTNGWNAAVFQDGRADYSVSTSNGTTTVTNIDPQHVHAGALIVDPNVEGLAFNPAHDPSPNPDGSVVATGDTLAILSAFNHSATISTGANLEFFGADSGSVTFQGSTGTMTLHNSAVFSGTIFNFTGDGTLSGSDHIDLTDININNLQQPSFTNGVLTVSDGAHTANLQFNGSYQLANFKFADDGSPQHGTIVYDPPVSSDDNTSALSSPQSGQDASKVVVDPPTSTNVTQPAPWGSLQVEDTPQDDTAAPTHVAQTGQGTPTAHDEHLWFSGAEDQFAFNENLARGALGNSPRS